MLPPVLHQGETLFKRPQDSQFSPFLPAAIPDGYHECHSMVTSAFPYQTPGCRPTFCFHSSMPIGILPVHRWLPGYAVHGTAWICCCALVLSLFSFPLSPPRAVCAFPPAVAVTRGAAGSCHPASGKVQVRQEQSWFGNEITSTSPKMFNALGDLSCGAVVGALLVSAVKH